MERKEAGPVVKSHFVWSLSCLIRGRRRVERSQTGGFTRWTSAGRTKEEKHENGNKSNRTRLRTFRKPWLSSWVGLSWISLSAFIPRLLLAVCGIYGGTKTEPDQRIKGSTCSFIQKRKLLFYRLECDVGTPKKLKIHDFMEWISNQGELKVTQTSFIRFLILLKTQI